MLDEKKLLNSLNEMESRIEGVEKILKLLLVDNIVEDIKDTLISKNEKTKNEVYIQNVELINKVLKKHGYNLKVHDVIFFDEIAYYRINVVNVSGKQKIGIKDILYIKNEIDVYESEINLIYYFTKLNGMLRKSLIKEEISFCIIDKEIHICSKK